MSDEECKVFWIFIIPLTWFAYWNANDEIRNISLLQEDNQ